MSRLDKLKKDNPLFNLTIMDLIAFADPSTTYKYCEAIVRVFKNEWNLAGKSDDEIKELLAKMFLTNNLYNTIQKFEHHFKLNHIQNKDLSTYKTFDDFYTEVVKAEELEKLKAAEKEVAKLYEDKEWLVVIPLSYESMKLYGANTKWCVTQKTHYNTYKSSHKIIVVINKPTGWKTAVSLRYDAREVYAWDAKDKQHELIYVDEIPDNILILLRNELKLSREQSDLRFLFGSETKLINSRKNIYEIEEATITELRSFIKKYGEHITTTHRENVERALAIKSLPVENDESDLKTVRKKIPKEYIAPSDRAFEDFKKIWSTLVDKQDFPF